MGSVLAGEVSLRCGERLLREHICNSLKLTENVVAFPILPTSASKLNPLPLIIQNLQRRSKNMEARLAQLSLAN